MIQDVAFNTIKREAIKFVLYLLVSLLPFLVTSTLIIALLFGVVFAFTSLFSSVQTSNVQVINFENSQLNNQDKTLDFNGQKYPLPRYKGNNELEFYALMTVRVPEFGTRQDHSLDGDADSCGTYQQRINEMFTNPFLTEKTKELLQDNYNSIFTKEVKAVVTKNNYKGRVDKTLTSNYGPRSFDYHYGVDYDYDYEPVFSVLDGEVIEVTNDEKGGQVIVIKHIKDNIRTLYAHLSSSLVKAGQKVKQGQLIAISGNTGIATTGSHLHFQILRGLVGEWNQDTINPIEYSFTSLVKNPFLNVCRMLSYAQIESGFYDRLFLERMYKEKPELKNFDLNNNSLSIFVSILCQVQRPVNCLEWESKAYEALTIWYLNNTFINIKNL